MPDVAALQLLVPDAGPLLSAVRGRPGVGLLEPPHVSLGYPWRAALDVDVPLVRAAAAAVAPFEVRFAGLRRFASDGRGRVLLYVAPDDDAPLRRLASLVDADLRSPHLSVARVLAGTDVDEVAALVEPLLPLVARVEVLELTVQDGGVWQPGQAFPLGRGAAATACRAPRARPSPGTSGPGRTRP